MLTKEPFEPMHRSTIQALTFKTVFLVALASGARRSEIHSLRSECQHSENWKDVTLFPDLQFVPKTCLIEKGVRALKTITLKSLCKEVDDKMIEDRSLCVVRAVRYYLDRTKDLRGDRKRLFISFKKGH